MFVTNCSNSSRFCVFHNVFKVPFKFNYKTTEQVTFLIRLSEYVRTGLLKLGDFHRRNTTATLKKKKKKRKGRRRKDTSNIEKQFSAIFTCILLRIVHILAHQPVSFPADFPSITFSSRSYKLFNSFLQNSKRSFSPPAAPPVRLFPSLASYFYRF